MSDEDLIRQTREKVTKIYWEVDEQLSTLPKRERNSDLLKAMEEEEERIKNKPVVGFRVPNEQKGESLLYLSLLTYKTYGFDRDRQLKDFRTRDYRLTFDEPKEAV
jgi:hypothetical protein